MVILLMNSNTNEFLDIKETTGETTIWDETEASPETTDHTLYEIKPENATSISEVLDKTTLDNEGENDMDIFQTS